MAITGTWKARQSIEAGARKWGTGINPVHAIRTGDGREIAPDVAVGTVPASLEQNQDWHDYNEDAVQTTWGYEAETGISDRPRLGNDTTMHREDADDFPQWGPYDNGLPGGSRIRSEDHGSADQTTSNQIPTETVTEGWRNKVSGTVSNARVSDVEQLFMQTSSMQRDRMREGSQRGAGSASRFSAPIRSRIVGKRVKVYSGGRRHADMLPKEQVSVVRGWWARSAGTGYTEWLQANSQNAVQPVTRDVPAPPPTGPTEGTLTADYGYQDEDVLPYV